MLTQQMCCTHGNIVEQAKTHGCVARCVMSGGANRAKSLPDIATHDGIGGGNACTCRMQGSGFRFCRHDGVGIDMKALRKFGTENFFKQIIAVGER